MTNGGATTDKTHATKETEAKHSGKRGFRLHSIIVHSIWMTIVGVILFRLASTTDSQQLVYVHVFAASGTVFATAPWLVQLLASTAILLFHNAGVCDLTWLIRPPSKDGAVADADSDGGSSGFGFEFDTQGQGRNAPQLQRNRTF